LHVKGECSFKVSLDHMRQYATLQVLRGKQLVLSFDVPFTALVEAGLRPKSR